MPHSILYETVEETLSHKYCIPVHSVTPTHNKAIWMICSTLGHFVDTEPRLNDEMGVGVLMGSAVTFRYTRTADSIVKMEGVLTKDTIGLIMCFFAY